MTENRFILYVHAALFIKNNNLLISTLSLPHYKDEQERSYHRNSHGSVGKK